MGAAHRQPPSASTVCWAASSHDRIQHVHLMQAKPRGPARPKRSARTTRIPLSSRCTAVRGHAKDLSADAAWSSNTSGATLEWTCSQFAAGGSPTRSEHQRRSQRAASREHDLRSTARGPRTQSGPAPSTDAGSSTANTVVLQHGLRKMREARSGGRRGSRVQPRPATKHAGQQMGPATRKREAKAPAGQKRSVRPAPQVASPLEPGLRAGPGSHLTSAIARGSRYRASTINGAELVHRASVDT